MGAETLQNSLQHNSHSALWDISLISMFCMCCVVFLGLKLKWFRAQLRFDDSSSHTNSAAVQGIGFKIKTNPEDYQVYKVSSEFAPISNQNPSKIKENGIKPPLQNSNLKVQQNSTKTNTEVAKPTLEKSKTVNFNPQPVEITNPNAQKYSDIITGTTNNHQKPSHYPSATVSKNLATKNPLAAQSFTKPVEKIKIVNKTPKRETPIEEEYDHSYLMTNNYSNAASIFFGGNAQVAPTPRPRKFVEMEEDNISSSSETCA